MTMLVCGWIIAWADDESALLLDTLDYIYLVSIAHDKIWYITGLQVAADGWMPSEMFSDDSNILTQCYISSSINYVVE